MSDYILTRGSAPLLISVPHDGTEIPPSLAARMTEVALTVPDTDWYVGRLYAGLAQNLGASLIRPRWSRYVVDLNRAPDDAALYPGQRGTGLVPTVSFADQPLYQSGAEPYPEEIANRIESYWAPYHDALQTELTRLRALHGRALLWDGHSIRSQVPMLFDGRLADFSLGTADGASCNPELRERLAALLQAQTRFNCAIDGRFKGGYITRHYGAPARGIDAVQLELAQCNYMDEDNVEFLPARAEAVIALIDALLRAALEPRSAA